MEKQVNRCSKPLQQSTYLAFIFWFHNININNWLTFLAPQFLLPSSQARPISVLKIPLQGNWADHQCLVPEVFPYLLVFGLMNLILLTKILWLLQAKKEINIIPCNFHIRIIVFWWAKIKWQTWLSYWLSWRYLSTITWIRLNPNFIYDWAIAWVIRIFYLIDSFYLMTFILRYFSRWRFLPTLSKPWKILNQE